jgi:transcriptional regulator with XRE-family HTH domain
MRMVHMPSEIREGPDPVKAQEEAARRVGGFIRALREERGFTQTTLAKACGVTGPHISQLEQGKQLPPEELCIKLAKALGCDPRALVLRVKEAKSPEVAHILYEKDVAEKAPEISECRRELDAYLDELEEILPAAEYESFIDEMRKYAGYQAHEIRKSIRGRGRLAISRKG